MAGPNSNASVPDDAIMLRAAGSCARSTRAGTEPKLAASNHTKAVPMPNVTTNTCGIVSTCAAAAAGMEASSNAATAFQATIIFFRFTRSANAPAKSPKTMYGQVSRTVSAATSAAEPVSL